MTFELVKLVSRFKVNLRQLKFYILSFIYRKGTYDIKNNYSILIKKKKWCKWQVSFRMFYYMFITGSVLDNSRTTSENKTSLSQRSPMSIARFVQWYITTEDVWNFNARFSFWAQKDSLFDNTVSSKWDVPWYRNMWFLMKDDIFLSSIFRMAMGFLAAVH